MAVNAPEADEFDREDLDLSPETHQAFAEMALERGEDYDPDEYERRVRSGRAHNPDPLDDVDAADGVEKHVVDQWQSAGE